MDKITAWNLLQQVEKLRYDIMKHYEKPENLVDPLPNIYYALEHYQTYLQVFLGKK